jgi:hypothetical protein
MSCLVSDLEFCWQLGEDGSGTSIDVEVRIPDRESHRLDAQRSIIAASLSRLAALAERSVRNQDQVVSGGAFDGDI